MLQAILDKIKTVDEKVDNVKEEVVNNGKRIGKLGLQIANLEDDAPTSKSSIKWTQVLPNVE